MSSFCWCIIKIENDSKKHFIENFISNYKRNDIYCIFDAEKIVFGRHSWQEMKFSVILLVVTMIVIVCLAYPPKVY